MSEIHDLIEEHKDLMNEIEKEIAALRPMGDKDEFTILEYAALGRRTGNLIGISGISMFFTTIERIYLEKKIDNLDVETTKGPQFETVLDMITGTDTVVTTMERAENQNKRVMIIATLAKSLSRKLKLD